MFVKVAEGLLHMWRKKNKKKNTSPTVTSRSYLCFTAYIDEAHPDSHSFVFTPPRACK